MALVTINQNPKISDTVLFDLYTPDANGCYLANPYMVDSVRILYVSRDIANGNPRTLDLAANDPTLEQQYAIAKAIACATPTPSNLAAVTQIQNQLNLTAQTDTVYFDEASVVAVFGDPNTFPAWLSSDIPDAILENVATDANGNPEYGHFQLEWSPVGMREGDYFICHTWTPLPAGDKMSAYQQFSLEGDTAITTSIPSHYTDPEKYDILQERYMPEIFKMKLASNDLTPLVLQELNKSVGKGFTFLENLSNQILDVIDANATAESYLNVLGDTFGLKLRSDDPTLWRRQIKRAIPLYKKKGTLSGLMEAMAQAGINLLKVTRLWQTISPFTYQESFFATAGQTTFNLTNVAIIGSSLNTLVYYRPNSGEWQNVNLSTIALSNNTGSTVMTWLGSTLNAGDEVRILYQIAPISNNQQSLENYIRNLPLSDQRDEMVIEYPLKNWNVRLIAEDDPMFNTVIPTLHPFFEEVIFGQIRTEFAYSENIYNMEEYNGSIRDSLNPCDIDLQFIDSCQACLSSQYTVDLEIENLSNDRIAEAEEILAEFTPFHAVLFSINYYGKVHDFVQPPVENIETLVSFSGVESAVVDAPQMLFNRNMDEGNGTNMPNNQLKRNMLSSMSQVYGPANGSAQNTALVLFSPDHDLGDTPIDPNTAQTYLEVLSPSANSGTYTIGSNRHHHAQLVTGNPPLPLNESAFTFRLSNEVVRQNNGTSITQAYFCTLSDTNVDFEGLNVKTLWDVQNDSSYTGGAWNIKIGSASYQIANILPNGDIVISISSAIITGNLTYQLLTDASVVITNSTTGFVTLVYRGLVNLGSGNVLIRGSSTPVTNITAISNIINNQNYLLYNGIQYPITGFPSNLPHEFYIDGYSLGSVAGASIVVYERLINMASGYFAYQGMELVTTVNLEQQLGILNGANPPTDENQITDDSHFKENFLILIGSDYYAITQINGTVITLNGPKYDWTLAGTSVSYTVIRSVNQETYIPPRLYPPAEGQDFLRLDRRGGDTILKIEQAASLSRTAAIGETLNKINRNERLDTVNQQEAIEFQIEYLEFVEENE